MSHLSKISLTCGNKPLLNRLAKKYGWTVHKEAEFINPYSKDRVVNPTVLRDAQNRVKLVLDKEGVPNVDAWTGSMGTDFRPFLKEYSITHVKQIAAMNGQTVVERGVDSLGNVVLEIAY